VDIVENHYLRSRVRSKSCIKKLSLDYLWFSKYRRGFMLCKCSVYCIYMLSENNC